MSERQQKLIELEVYRHKLDLLVGDLLKQADELSQSSQFKESLLPESWHQRLALSLRDLAVLSETIGIIDLLLKAAKMEFAERSLLRCSNIATQISERITELKQAAGNDRI